MTKARAGSWLKLAAATALPSVLLSGSGTGAPESVPPRTSEQLRIVVNPSDTDFEDCDDTMELRIFDADREIYKDTYCSKSHLGGARLVTDARGRHYVLIEQSPGGGEGAPVMFLEVNQLLDHLFTRARLRLPQAAAGNADAVGDYRVETPPTGGIVLRGPASVEEEAAPGEPDPSAAHAFVVRIDTETEAPSS